MSDSGEPAEQMTISAAEIQQPTSAPVDNADEQPAVEKSADSESADVPASAAQPNRASLAAFVGEFESSAAASPPTGSKRKRSRRNTMEAKAAAPENNSNNNDDEDINLHVEADWSDDEKDDKEPSSKRAVAEADNGAPSAAKKPMPSALEDFTIRAVVTRKDVDVIFEHREGAKEKLERDTDTRIGIVAGTDDPDIVVDRVLVIKGPIDGVATAYKIITEGMLAIKLSKAAASAADTSAPAAKQKQSDKDGMHDEDASDDEGDDSKQAAAGPENAEGAGLDADEAGSPRASGADSDNDGPDDDDHTNNTAIREGVAKPAATGESKPADDANKAEKPAVASDAPASASTASSDEKKGRTSQSSSADHITLRMLVPQKCVGSIMGHGGRSINRIRDEASVNIHTSEDTLPRSSERIVAVVGTPSAIQKSIVLMATALTRDIVSYNNAELYVPAANLPSAMTVETNHRKRRDAKRQNQGYNDHYSGNRNYSNRSSGYRQNGGSSHGSGYRNNNYGSSGGGNRNYGHASNGNSGYGRNNMHGSNRNDRYSRSSNDRQNNRGRTPGTISHVNRMPVGASTNTPSHHGNSNNSNYRSGGHGSGNRTASSPNAANYGGYPAPSPTFYQSYRPHASGPSNMGGGGNGAGGMTGMRYGTAMSPVSPGQNSGVYGGGFATAPVPYQFASPVGYAYPAAPVQGMYGGPAAQPSQPYPSRGGRPMMSQGQYSHPQQPPPQQQQQQQPRYDGQYQRQPMLSPSLGMGAAPPSGPSASGYAPGAVDQTIQKIYVSADKVGAVIGHRGETINNIRQSTNARVDIQDPAHGSQERLIIITGGYEQVHSAFSMIKNKIATTRPSGMRP